MKKRTVLCFLICTVCVFYSSIPNPALAQGRFLAQQVFQKHKRTLQRADVQEVLPQVLDGLKAPDTQALLNPGTINAVVNNPDLLPIFIPEIEPRFVTLLKRDQTLKNFLRDPLVQRLLQSPAAIGELAGLLGIGAEFRPPDLSVRQIYDQTIDSVVWIRRKEGNQIWSGSGTLIDKKRRLVVTNRHVIENENWVDVFFPYRERGTIKKNQDFYVNKKQWLRNRGYAARGRRIARNVRDDLAIIQLDQLPPTAKEIKHDFSRNVEESMKDNDKVHILGNPGERMWVRTEGTFKNIFRDCLNDGGDCLWIEGDAAEGFSGGPIINSQGILVGILTSATQDELELQSTPAKNVKALLNTVPANLSPIPPQQIYPKRVFQIRNHTGVTIHYQIKWSNSNDWKSNSLKTGFIMTHWSGGQQIPTNYPKIRFDHIAGDNWVTYHQYPLKTAQFRENNDHAPTYFFRYNDRGDRLDLYRDRDVGAAPALSKTVPKENALFANYPNPFNPETWIPYQLATPANVKVAIYAADGTRVRTLALGHQAAGVYQSKGRAAYWDGTNELGEPVASGVYFYTLTAGEFRATRKLLIRK